MLAFSPDVKLGQRSQSYQLPTSPRTEEVEGAQLQRERMTETQEPGEEGKERRTAR